MALLMANQSDFSTGLDGLDRVLKGLMAGDNVVWQVDSTEDYAAFVEPYCRRAVQQGRKCIYFRFATHRALLSAADGVEVVQLRPHEGFEAFLTEIHRVIEQAGRGAYYVFDCLSELTADWYSDQMLGNFFRLTCPYLYDLETIAYFALLKNYHSFRATSPIAETTQLLLDVYRHAERLYVHPIKVEHRYSRRMNMLHAWQGDQFVPVMQSSAVAEILTSTPWSRIGSATNRLDVWANTFLEAEELFAAEAGRDQPSEEASGYFRRLVRMAVSRDERVLALVERYMTLSDVLEIGRRMLGTGLIGGKSVGMLLARAILKKTDPAWATTLEPHDSFYIGSDAFYTFLVQNGVWWVRQNQRNPDNFLQGAERARQRILTGSFPEYIEKQFSDMLDYYGQAPIIVRSSSLLEDNFGNAFAGKYDSVFCPNQGPREERLAEFLSAIRKIYASTMSERALVYRAQRGLLGRDEQMALLVQRVSGSMYGDLYYPQLAGVALSFNPYVWSPTIDPKAGMMRLVFGLGTRAVDRSDDDYTRIVALNEPRRRPDSSEPDGHEYTQRKVDVLDLHENQLVSSTFEQVAAASDGLNVETFATRDMDLEQRAAASRIKVWPWRLTFEHVLERTDFAERMRAMLATLDAAYDWPVDVEFTANFESDGRYRINVVQCRPFQARASGEVALPTGRIDPDKLLLRAHGAVIGQSRITRVDRFIYVVPEAYGQLPVQQRYAVARLIGRLCHAEEARPPETIMLLGPGRWGTTTPSLGVPISFADINTVSILCEIVAMRDDLIPDVSLGTHLFSDLVEMDILYLALFPEKDGNALNRDFFSQAPNRLADLLPDTAEWARVVRVIDPARIEGVRAATLHANVVEQDTLCYLDDA